MPLCAAAFFANSQQGGDLQAQIQYAFHVEAANQLANLIQTLSTQVQAGGADSTLRYHLAHAEYRAGLLAAETGAPGAPSSFTECIEQLKPVLQQDGNSVEALALQSACYSNLARLKKLESMLLRSRAADRLKAAFKLAPRNPRVLYLMAMDADSDSFAQLQLAAQIFERSSATRVDEPGWGNAEAYLELGRCLQSRGDILGARNWIEKSLIAAPDYKAAQRQLATLIPR